MYKIVFISVLFGSASFANILSDCQKKWGNDYSMVKYCVDKQTNAEHKVSKSPNGTIKSNCKKKWGADHSMVVYCINKQSEAKRSLGL